jgi:hypothetical protein
MKRHHFGFLLVLISAVAGSVLWSHLHAAAPLTMLSFRIGQSFEEVARNSTFPVKKHSNIPASNDLLVGQTFVTEPAVILRFSDSQHGFSLPPTRFAMVTYIDNTVGTVATSPLLEKLPFDQAVAILENLQDQFKAGGWEPWENNTSQWFDLTPDGKKRLYARMLEPGFSQEATLRIPGKYAMTFRLWCAEGCMTYQPPYLFLIDIGVGSDVYADVNFSLEAK